MQKLTKEEREQLYKEFGAQGMHFLVELSLSSRSKCRGCQKKIQKDDLRFRHVVCNSRCCSKQLNSCGSWHPKCFLEQQEKDDAIFKNSNPDTWKPVVSTALLIGSDNLGSDELSKLEQLLVTK